LNDVIYSPIKKTTKRMLEAIEKDFWRRTTRSSTLKTVTNERIREIMQVTYMIVDKIKNR